MGRRYAVSCGHPAAAIVATRILERGGNAIDAGVAASMALAVVQPDIVSFSGVAPTLVYRASDRRVHGIEGLGHWPAATDADRLRDEGKGAIPDGILRTVLPAAPATHVKALRAFGTISFEEAAQGAYEIAAGGFAAYPNFVRHIEKNEAKYRRWPSSAAVYLPGGRPPRVGEIFRQAELAQSIGYLIEAERRASGDRDAKLAAVHDAYYKGRIAEAIAQFHRDNGGWVTRDDLAGFAVELESSVHTRYKDYEVHVNQPWCQGLTLLETLKILEHVPLGRFEHNSVAYVHHIAEALNLAFADREAYLGDPRFIDVPVKGLLDAGYAAEQGARIRTERAFGDLPTPGKPPGATREPFIPDLSRFPRADAGVAPDTIYCCVADGEGNAYSATLSDSSSDTPVISGYGGNISSRGRQSRLESGHPSEVKPGKRPRLTPAPAIALREGRFALAWGTPGGDVQLQAMLQVFLNVTAFGMQLQQAIEQPRFGTFTFPNSFSPFKVGGFNMESRFSADTMRGIAELGHRLEPWDALAPAAGAVCAIARDFGTGWLHAGADPRREAYALAW